MRDQKNYRFAVFLGLIGGAWLAFSADSLLLCFFLLVVFLILRKAIPADDYPFIVKFSLGVFLLRSLFIFLYYHFYLSNGPVDLFGPDGEIYIQRGWYISRLILGQNPYIVPNNTEFIFKTYYSLADYYRGMFPPVDGYQVGLSSYLIGIVFSIFGYVPLLIKSLNSLMGILSAAVVYLIGREIFSRKVARLSFAIFLLWPSIFIFSGTVLKEPLLLLLTSLVIYLIVLYARTSKKYLLILSILLIYVIHEVRYELTMPFVFTLATAVFAFLKIKNWKKFLLFGLICVSALFLFHGKVSRFIKPNVLFSRHLGFIWTPGYNYKFLPEIRYIESELPKMTVPEISLSWINAILHFIFEPFPSKVNAPLHVFAFFQNIMLFLLFPFILLGLIVGLRYRFKQMIPIIVYSSIIVLAMSICEGNIGTVFRHRLILVPFWAVLFSVGWCQAFLKDNRAL